MIYTHTEVIYSANTSFGRYFSSSTRIRFIFCVIITCNPFDAFSSLSFKFSCSFEVSDVSDSGATVTSSSNSVRPIKPTNEGWNRFWRSICSAIPTPTLSRNAWSWVFINNSGIGSPFPPDDWNGNIGRESPYSKQTLSVKSVKRIALVLIISKFGRIFTLWGF